MLSKKAPLENNVLKVIDFGDAVLLGSDVLTTKVGTAYYSAPEVLAIRVARYGQECDLWSCGVIMYVLLSGRSPFFGKTDVEVMQRVRRGNYAFGGTPWT